jgi:hypothetical protein
MFKYENGYTYIVADDGDVLCWRRDKPLASIPAHHRWRLNHGFTPPRLVKQGVDGPVTKQSFLKKGDVVTKQGPKGPFVKGF